MTYNQDEQKDNSIKTTLIAKTECLIRGGKMKYLVSGPVNVDKIYPLIQGKYGAPKTEIGGGGIYAASAIKLWDERCMPVVYVGADYAKYYAPWLRRNGFDTEGFVAAFDQTVQTQLYYQEDGRYTIGWQQGDLGTGRAAANIQLLQPYLNRDIKGVHLVTHGNAVFFEQVNQYRQAYNFQVGWEINNTQEFYVDAPLLIETVAQKYVDYFSLSYGELRGYFPDTRDITDALQRCASWGCPVYLRNGTHGAFLICNQECWKFPMMDDFGTIDPTGCGNTSTASVFWARCEGRSPEASGLIGAITAGLNASYYGLIPHLTNELRERCNQLLTEKLLDGTARRVKLR